MIISWSRLLAGGFRDPLVGRDILIGGLLGLSHTVAGYSISLLSHWSGAGYTPNPGAALALYRMQRLIAQLLSTFIINAIIMALGFLFVLLLLYIALRKEWLAAAALWVIFFSIEFLAFVVTGPWLSWISVVTVATVYVIATSRFGLLTLISLQLFFHLTFHYPITPYLSSLYGGTTIFTMLVTTGLAVYGFYTSLGGQPLIRANIFSD